MKIGVLLGNREHPAFDITASGETEMKQNLPPGHIGSDIALAAVAAAVDRPHPLLELRAASAGPS